MYAYSEPWRLTPVAKQHMLMHGYPRKIDIKIFKGQTLLQEFYGLKTLVVNNTMELAENCESMAFKNVYPSKALIYTGKVIWAYLKIHCHGPFAKGDTMILNFSNLPILTLTQI